MATLASPVERQTLRMTWDPFCSEEGVQTLQSSEHFYRLARIVHDLRLHLEESGLPYSLASDLLIRNIPLKPGVAPDVALWPGHLRLEQEKYGSLELSADLCPVLILEVVSAHTGTEDAHTKHEIYRRIGVAEYWLYDPDAHVSDMPLRGWQLDDEAYVPIPGYCQEVSGQPAVLYASAVLQTDWGLTEDGVLRLQDPQQADWYRTTPAALRRIRRQAAQDRDRAAQAEAQAAQDRDRADQAEAQATQDRDRAVQAEAQAAQDRDRADQAEAEIARLRARLQAQTHQDGTTETGC